MVLEVLCLLVGRICSALMVFAVDVVVRVVLCICWVAGVGGTCKVLPWVRGTLLVVRGGGCRRSVVVVGFGVGRLLPSSSLLDCRGTGRREGSFLRMPGALRRIYCSARCCTSFLGAAARMEAVHLILMERACEYEKDAHAGLIKGLPR